MSTVRHLVLTAMSTSERQAGFLGSDNTRLFIESMIKNTCTMEKRKSPEDEEEN